MLFKNFHIDADSVVVDNQTLIRPSYISPSQWYDFWSFSPEANDSGSIQRVIDTEVDAIVRSHENEHEEELEKQAREIINNFDDQVSNLVKIARNIFDDLEDAIEKIRPIKDE